MIARFCSLLLGLVWVGQTFPALAGDLEIDPEKPKRTYVAVAQAQLRSGPSDEYYPTDVLKRNQALEARLRTGDGWIGVKPPHGSFSWVPAQNAYLLPGGRVIEITSDSAVSWIGTNLGSAKQYRWQVPLNRGDQLTLLGEANVNDSSGKQTLWYKISPPADELRWIRESAVSTEPVQDATPGRSAPQRPEQLQTASVERDADRSDSEEPPRIVSSNAQRLPARDTAGDLQQDASTVMPVSASEPSGGEAEADAVQTAGYEDDVFAEGPSSASPTIVQRPRQATADRWAGWHAWELDDSGFRFTLFDRLVGRPSGQQHDPLRHDPFALDMAASQRSGARPPASMMEPATSSVGVPSVGREMDGRRKWRDPRQLREQRLSGSRAALNRTPGELVASIRDGVAQLSDSLRSRTGLGDRSASLNQPRDSLGTDDELLRTNSDRLDAREQRPRQTKLVDRSPRSSSDDEEVDWYGAGASRSLSALESGYSIESEAARTGAESATRLDLEALQVALGEMVSQPPGLWQLGPIIRGAEHIVQHGATPVERGQARLLLDRIREFEQHARRTAFATSGVIAPLSYQPARDATSVTTASYASSRDSVNASSELAANVSNDEVLVGKQPYDATGWLVPVHSTEPGKPNYALTNREGAIIAYVTSLPGMNLSSYANQAVGIIGLRGYLPQLQSPHIQAQRVIVLRGM